MAVSCGVQGFPLQIAFHTAAFAPALRSFFFFLVPQQNAAVSFHCFRIFVRNSHIFYVFWLFVAASHLNFHRNQIQNSGKVLFFFLEIYIRTFPRINKKNKILL